MPKKALKCGICGKIAKEAKLRFQGYDINGWRCSCGEEYFDPDESQKILSLNKVLNTGYKVKVGQIRSNLIIRIPTELAKALGLEKGETVRIKADSANRFHVET